MVTIPEYKKTFVMGVPHGPLNIDPHFAWDQSSIDVIEQSVEGLFAYNLTDPNFGIIPKLAADNFNIHTAWSSNKKEITIPLRRNVFFHDGAPFNARAVKWSFDRLLSFINRSSTPFQCLYMQTDVYRTPIIKELVIINDYTIKFILNKQYPSFLDLLCFSGSKVLSPLSTPENKCIDPLEDGIIGTGPFKFEIYFENTEVRFQKFDNYWRKNTKVEVLVFSVIEDAEVRNRALIGASVHTIKDPLENFKDSMDDDPNIIIWEGGQSLAVQYLGMNSNIINKSGRQAISYAIDYDFIIDTLQCGNAVRLKSPIPLGISHSRWDFKVAKYNITKARFKMKEVYPHSPLIDNNISNGNPWVLLASSKETALASYTFIYIGGNLFHKSLLGLLQNNLSQIGIYIEGEELLYPEFIERLYKSALSSEGALDLYWNEWNPAMIAPLYYVYPLLHSESRYNSGRVSDPYLNYLLTRILEVDDTALKEELYFTVQKYLVEDLMPWAYGFCELKWWPFRNNVAGLEYYAFNPVGITYLYHVDIIEN
jgi:ABC-type transport system substrate-binding protein